VAYLEPFMDRQDTGNNAKGTVVIATVKGMSMILVRTSWISFCLITATRWLTWQAAGGQYYEAYEQHKADCIAMSGLLVKSTAFMKENLETFNQRGITVPVILGGAALTPKFVNQDCQNTYKGKVVYGKMPSLT